MGDDFLDANEDGFEPEPVGSEGAYLSIGYTNDTDFLEGEDYFPFGFSYVGEPDGKDCEARSYVVGWGNHPFGYDFMAHSFILVPSDSQGSEE